MGVAGQGVAVKMTVEKATKDLLRDNERRQAVNRSPFDPVSGQNSVGERKKVVLPDFPIAEQWLPVEMLQEPLVKELLRCKSVTKCLKELGETEITVDKIDSFVREFCKIRNKYDYPFWAAVHAYIHNKTGGDDVLFRLNRPQRRLVERLERMRKAGKPIRLVLLKARQWGGSTCIQLYMAWLQLCHKTGLNSLIIAHQGTGSDEIKDMFDTMIKAYPIEMLHELGDIYQENEPKIVGVGKSGNIFRVPQRNCKIKIGTAERPNSCRGGAYSLVHLSEVALWKSTEKMSPEKIVRSALSGVLFKPMTMIVYESTPSGVGNSFHKEYQAAKEGKSQMEAMFVSWFEIEQYELEFSPNLDLNYNHFSKEEFARWLWENRNSEETRSEREESGNYLWRLWTMGATLEAIHWYIRERAKYTNHGDMASEYPSDDIEAFTFSGRKVFSSEDVERFRSGCRPARKVGEIYGAADKGEEALKNVRFVKEDGGRLKIWHDVEPNTLEETVTERYLVVVDVCKGHTEKADFADILVIDRLPMMDGEPPVVAAEWHGHIDMDLLAWKAAQIATYYNNALLVIESNTLETNNTKGEGEYILTLIHDAYGDQLYARKQSAEDIQNKVPKKYGFHTNTLTKPVIILNLKMVVREHLYVEREEEALDEMLIYVETDKGGYEAMEGYHDDRLMTRAIGMQVSMYEMELPRILTRENMHSGYARATVSEATI